MPRRFDRLPTESDNGAPRQRDFFYEGIGAAARCVEQRPPIGTYEVPLLVHDGLDRQFC